MEYAMAEQCMALVCDREVQTLLPEVTFYIFPSRRTHINTNKSLSIFPYFPVKYLLVRCCDIVLGYCSERRSLLAFNVEEGSVDIFLVQAKQLTNVTLLSLLTLVMP